MVPNRSHDGGKYVIHVVLHQLGLHGFADVSDSLDGPEFSDEGVGGRGGGVKQGRHQLHPTTSGQLQLGNRVHALRYACNVGRFVK